MKQPDFKKHPFEGRLIPWWSYLLATGIFIGFLALLYPAIQQHRMQDRPVALSIFWGIWVGLYLGFYMLMVGYVLRDSRRRGMNPMTWLVIMLALMPAGLGFVVYFLLRSPIEAHCPKCGTHVGSDFNYCSHCQYQLKPVCEHCQHALRPADAFCAYCGSAVSESQQLFAVR